MVKIFKYYKFFMGLSAAIFVAGVIALAIFGLNLGIDFKGGTVMELSFPNYSNDTQEKVRQALVEAETGNFQIQQFGEKGVIIKAQSLSPEQQKKVAEKIKLRVGDYEEKRSETIGPVIGKELTSQAILQLIFVSLGIILYIGYAFRKVTRPITAWQFGISAVIALFHDLVVVLGVFAILGHYHGIEVDSMFVTALLTVLGFSVHDTIVVFDRIRENLKHSGNMPLSHVVDISISQTLVRSINTSLTVVIVLVTLLLFGGSTLFNFVLTLLIGVVAGTYSSIFIASPILVIWQNARSKSRK